MGSRRKPAAIAAFLLILTSGGLTAASASAAPVAAPSTAPASPATVTGEHDDFNGDGYPDLVVGAPSATVGGKRAAGYVAVLYGSKSGVTTAKRAVFSQNSAGVPGTAETGDAFGDSVAGGDLDGDGYADLAVGTPGEDLPTGTDAGAVVVFWGSPSGLGRPQWTDEPEGSSGRFGSALTTGDFDLGGRPDLAVLTSDRLWTLSFTTEHAPGPASRAPRPRSIAEDGVQPMGLASGDFDRDDDADLVVLGVTTGTQDGYGWSAYFTGGPEGLTYQRDLKGGPVGAAGDIDKDGYADLVTAEPNPPDDGGEWMTGGVVEVWYGGPNGPGGDAAGAPEYWTQASPGVPGAPERGDGFGSDLSLGDVDGDGYADLAVGSEGEDIGTVADAGGTALLRGGPGGLTGAKAQGFDQNSPGVPGTAERLDRFGGQVRLIDANSDGRAGLIAAAPGENTFDGVAWLFNGTANGLTASGSWTFGGGSLNAPYADAQFGSSMAE